jgi:hypothetical protein
LNGYKRPLAVTIIAWVYIAVGTIGFAAHSGGLRARDWLAYDNVLIEVVEIVAVVAGVFTLRGRNWARWLTVAWIAFHVVLSAFHSLRELVIHGLIWGVIAWMLFRPEANNYFGRDKHG